MKIFGHYFVFPILFQKGGTFYGDKPDLSFRFRKSGMAGSMRSTSYTLEITTQKNRWQWCFCWRPDVTRYWWLHSTK